MRVTKQKAAENRLSLLEAASRLFRKRGIDGAGVADIAKEAGLTQGALYAHFPSKEALAAEAFSHAFAGNMADTREWAGDRNPTFQDYVDGYCSPYMREKLETGCPMAASASEIGRQDSALSESFARAFEERATLLENALKDTMTTSERRRLAIAAVAAEIGSIAVSRAIAKADPLLADEVLEAVRKTIDAVRQLKSNGVS